MTLLKYEHISPYAQMMGFKVLYRSPDRLEVLLPSADRLQNRKGDLHGGALMGLIDTTLGMAATQGDITGTSCSTLSLTVNFLAVGKGEVRCISHMSRRGHSIRFLSAEVFDEDDTLIATASGSFKVFRPKALA